MTSSDLINTYRSYIGCLNDRDLDRLGNFVAHNVEHNAKPLDLAGYRRILEENYRDIPDLRFDIQVLVADRFTVASRFGFDCRPIGHFLGLNIAGKRVSFCENAIYEFSGGKIWRVWSVIDKAAIEAQLSAP